MMNENKLRNIVELNPDERYWYLIREVVKLEKVWAVSAPDSWVTFLDEGGEEIFPIWPHKEVAELCILKELKVSDYVIESIDFDKFIEFCIPDMKTANVSFGIFYDLKREAIVVSPEKLKTDLEEEKQNTED